MHLLQCKLNTYWNNGLSNIGNIKENTKFTAIYNFRYYTEIRYRIKVEFKKTFVQNRSLKIKYKFALYIYNLIVNTDYLKKFK